MEGGVVTGQEAVQVKWEELQVKLNCLDIGTSDMRYLETVPTVAPNSSTYIVLRGKLIEELASQVWLMRYDYKIRSGGFVNGGGTNYWAMRLPSKLDYTPSKNQYIEAMGLVIGPMKINVGFFSSNKTITLIDAVAIQTFRPESALYY